MKLLDLLENFYTYKVDGDLYNLDFSLQVNSRDRPNSVDIDVDIINFDAYASNPRKIIRQVLVDLLSKVSIDHPYSDITVNSLSIKHKTPMGEIHLGTKELFRHRGRVVILTVDDPEESVDDYMSDFNAGDVPTLDKCMTRLKRDSTVIKAFTKKYDIIDTFDLTFKVDKKKTIAYLFFKKVDQYVDVDKIQDRMNADLNPYGINPLIRIDV